MQFKLVFLKQLITVHGLTFGRGYYRKDFVSEIWGAYFREGLFIYLFRVGGGGGRAYYRNFAVYGMTLNLTSLSIQYKWPASTSDWCHLKGAACYRNFTLEFKNCTF